MCDVRKEVLERAQKTGKEALKPTTMAIRLVEAACNLRPSR